MENKLYVKEIKTLVDYLIKNHETIKWNKEDSTQALYRYTTNVNGIDVTFRAFSSAYHKRGYYAIIDVEFDGITGSMSTNEDENEDKTNTELFELEALLGEDKTYEKKDADFKNIISGLGNSTNNQNVES